MRLNQAARENLPEDLRLASDVHWIFHQPEWAAVATIIEGLRELSKQNVHKVQHDATIESIAINALKHGGQIQAFDMLVADIDRAVKIWEKALTEDEDGEKENL